MKLTESKKNFIVIVLVILTNLVTWSASLNLINKQFMLLGAVMFSFTVALFVTFRIQIRMDRRKAEQENRTWVGKTNCTMRDWMKSNPY